MVSMEELLSGNKLSELPVEHQENLHRLLGIINKVRVLWAKPMVVTTGYRTMEHHIQIYKDIAARNNKKFDLSKVPKKSNHLYGLAVDIADTGLKLYKWLEENKSVMEECGIFCEKGTTNWVHIQIVPFGSYVSGGTRWFNVK